MIIVLGVVLVLLFVGLAVAASSVHILREYERAVVFRLGRLSTLQGPGVVLLAPFINRVVRVSLRTVTLQVPPQEIITRDNVPARVTAVAYFRVIDPNKSIVEIQDVQSATSQIAQTTLRSVLGKAELDTLLSERERLNEDLQHIIDDQTEPWGVKVTTVEIKDVEIPEQMQHSMARQAEAERERRAKIIDAEGEFQAAAKLLEAADLISRNPVTIQLRYLQTLREIGDNDNNTIVVPVPAGHARRGAAEPGHCRARQSDQSRRRHQGTRARSRDQRSASPHRRSHQQLTPAQHPRPIRPNQNPRSIHGLHANQPARQARFLR